MHPRHLPTIHAPIVAFVTGIPRAIDVSAAVTGLDLLFSSFAEVGNHEKAPAVAPPDFIPFESLDEGLCASPTAPVLEQDSSLPSAEETAAVPVAKKNARYTQSTLPWCKMGGNTGATPPSPADQQSTPATASTQVSPSVPGPSKPAGPDAIYAEALYKYKSEGLDRFSWLILLKPADGLPAFKCSICTEHAGYAGPCGRGGKGATDVQTHAFKRHAATTKHKEAFKHQENILSEAARQPRINDDNLARATEKERVIKLLDSLIFVTKQDAPIELWVNLVRYLAALKHILSSPFLGVTCDESTDRCRGKHMIIFATFIRDNHIVTEFLALLTVEKCDAASLLSVFLSHLQALGIDLARISGMSTDGASVMMGKNNDVVARLRLRIPHLEALTAKDATEALPEFEMVDSLLRQVAEHLGRSGPWHQWFMLLQEVFTATNLELRRIHQVRWLSRGDAILRAVEVFPALIVMLYEWDSTLYELATDYRFHFLLYFLADVLEQLNVLSRAFQQREIRRSLSFLESCYVDCGDDFGGGMRACLSPFIKKHGPEGGRPEVKVQGVDSDGRPTTHTFQLHENPSEDYPTRHSRRLRRSVHHVRRDARAKPQQAVQGLGLPGGSEALHARRVGAWESGAPQAVSRVAHVTRDAV
ncbi:unnamed protein product [Closterium sp. NIES-53]